MTTRELVRDVALVVGGICIGSGTTYILTKRHLEQKWIAIVEEEVAKTENHFRIIRKMDESDIARGYSEQEVIEAVGGNTLPLPGDDDIDLEENATVFQEAIEAFDRYSGAEEPDEGVVEALTMDTSTGPYWGVQKRVDIDETVDKGRLTVENIIANASIKLSEEMDTEEDEEQSHNIFEEDEADRVPERKPNSDAPYVVSIDQHFEDDNGYEKITVTYYEADDVLSDERDQMVNNFERIIGPDFTQHWGAASKDPNIVYIRNDKLEVDYEVIRDKRSYHVHVLGIPMDPREVKKRHRRMQDDD
jgi:hypothetical protein